MESTMLDRAQLLNRNRRANGVHADYLYPLFLTGEKIVQSTFNTYAENHDANDADLSYRKIFDVQTTSAGEHEPANMIDFVQKYSQTAHVILLSTNMAPPTSRLNEEFFNKANILWMDIQKGYPNAIFSPNLFERYKYDFAAQCNLRVLFGNQFESFFETPEDRLYYLYTLMTPAIGFDGCVGTAANDPNLKCRPTNSYTCDELNSIVEEKGDIHIECFRIKYDNNTRVPRSCMFTWLVKECTNQLSDAPLWRYLQREKYSSIVMEISYQGINDVAKIATLEIVLMQMYNLSILKNDSLKLMYMSFKQNRLGLGKGDFVQEHIEYRSKAAIKLRMHKEKVKNGAYSKEHYDNLFQRFSPANDIDGNYHVDRKLVMKPGRFSSAWILCNHFAAFMGSEGSYALGIETRHVKSVSLLDYRRKSTLKLAQSNFNYNKSAAEVLTDIFHIKCKPKKDEITMSSQTEDQIRFLIVIAVNDMQRRDQMINHLISLHQSQETSVIEEYKDWCFTKWLVLGQDKKRKQLLDRGYTNKEIDSIFEHGKHLDEGEDDEYSFSFFFDEEYVKLFLKVVTQLPLFVHYVQVSMTSS